MAEQFFSTAEAADMLGLHVNTFKWRVANLGIEPAFIGKNRTKYYSASQLLQVDKSTSPQVDKSTTENFQVAKSTSRQVDNEPEIINGEMTPISQVGKSASRQVDKSTTENFQVAKSTSRQVDNEPEITNGEMTPILQVGKSTSRQVDNDDFHGAHVTLATAHHHAHYHTNFENGNSLQIISNLPQEILDQKRFFKVGKNKVPLVQAWSNPDNQSFAHDIDGLVGFDTSGHDLAVDYLLIDFDHVLDDNGKFINKKAEFWYNFCAQSGSYCEISISGHGIHIILKLSPGKFPPIANGKNGVLDLGDGAKIELFYKTKGRYCLLTGKVFNCNPNSPITDGNAADQIFQALLDEIKKQNQLPAKAKQPTFDDIITELGSDYDLFRAQRMLDDINPADLADSDWLAVISAAKNIGISYFIVDSWNQRDPDRYKESENQARWDSLENPNYNIETLHGIAKRFHYSEKDSRREWFKLHPELSNQKKAPRREGKFSQSASTDIDKKIADWQTVNGIINPQILADLRSFINIIVNVSDFADAASNTSYQKFLGFCRFYSPFALAEQKFFNDLRDAVSTAKAKVKAWDKHIRDTDKYNSTNIGAKRELDLSKKPADPDFALAAINPRTISEKADSYANEAKKEHKKWLIQHRCDELNAKRDAEKQAYEDAPPTTQQTVDDCPIDLILPEGSTFSDNSIKYVDWDKPAKEGRPRVEICQNPIVPTKFFRNAESGLVFYEVAIKGDYRWHSHIFEARTFMDARAVLILSNFGLKISEPRLLVKFFAKFFAINEQNKLLPQKRIYSQPGWHDGEFIFPTGTDDYTVRRDGIDYPALFAEKGSTDDWIAVFKKVLHIGQIIPISDTYIQAVMQDTFGFALVAPALHIFGLPNQQLLIWGNKNSSKSPILKFALSIFGNPNEGKLFRNMSATDKNKMAIAAGLNDLPVGYDEAESAGKFADLEKAGYDFFGGTINQANKRNGEVRAAESFRGVRIMTGENPILDTSTAKGGSLKRLIQLRLNQPFMSVTNGRDLHIFLSKNFGHFLKTWINYIEEHADSFKRDLELVIAVIDEDSIVNGKRIFDYRKYEQTNFIAITAAMVCYYHFLVAVGIDEEFNAQDAADYVRAVMRELPTADELDDYTRARRLIRSFAISKIKFFYRESFTGDPTASKHDPFEKYGIIYEDGGIAFFTSCFKSKVWAEIDLRSSYERFLSDAYEAGHLACANRRNKFRTIRINGFKTNVYYFRAETFQFDSENNQSADQSETYLDEIEEYFDD